MPEGSTEAEIRRDILLSYLAFYLDKEKIKRIFAKPKEGAGWFNAGEKVVEILKKLPALTFLFLLLSIKFVQLFFKILFKDDTYSLIDLKRLLKDDGIRI